MLDTFVPRYSNDTPLHCCDQRKIMKKSKSWIHALFASRNLCFANHVLSVSEKEDTIKSAKQGGRSAKFIGMSLQTPSSFRSAFTNISGVPDVYI